MVPPAPRQRPSAMEESTIDFLLPAEQDDTDSSIEFLPPPLRQGKRPKRVRRPQGMGASQILERPQDPQLSQISERPKGQDASRKLKHSQLQETSRILDPLQQLKSSRVVGRPQRLESSHTLERPQEIDRSIQTSQPVANTKASRAPPAKDPSISSEAKERVESIERPKGKAQPSRIPDPTQRSAKGCKVPTAATSTDAAFSVPVIPRGDVDPARTSTSNVLTPVTPADSTGLKGKGSSRRVFSSTQKPDKSDEWQQAKLSATPTGLTEADQNRLVSAISEAMVDPNQEWTPPLPPKDPAKLEQYEALMQASKTLTASKASSKRLKTPRSAERQTPSAASSPPTGRLRVTRMSLLQEALVEDKNLWRSATTSMSRKSEDQATKSDSLETIDLDSSEPWAPSTPPLSPHRTGESSMVPRLTLPAPNTETAMVVRRPSGPNEDAMLDDYMVLDEDSVHYTKRTARNGTMFRNAELQRLLSSQRLALQYGAPIVGMTIAGPLVSVLDPSMTGRCIAILIGHFSRLRLRNATVRDLHRALSAAGLGTTSGQVGSLFAVLGWGALFGKYRFV